MVRAISGKASSERGIFMDETSLQLAAEEIVEKVVFEAQLKQVLDDARRGKRTSVPQLRRVCRTQRLKCRSMLPSSHPLMKAGIFCCWPEG